MRLAPVLRAARAALVISMAAALVAGLAPSTPLSLDKAKLAATATGDCNGNGILDLKEVAAANRDDDGDGVCNGIDACIDEAGSCNMQAITVPADPSDLSVPHLTYSGASHTLKGIARYGGTQYMWDYGDGAAPTAWTNMSNTYNLGINHVYTGAVGTRFVATLSVRNSAAPAVVASDTYTVEIGVSPTGTPAGTPVTAAQIDVRSAMAVDLGRWYLHTNMARGTFADGAPGYKQPYGQWATTAFSFNTNCIALDALLTGGSLPEGDYANDPYVEDVRRSLNYNLSLSVSGAISNQTPGGVTRNPDGNGNGIGVRLGNNAELRITAGCLTALAHTGSPDRVATAGPNANVYARTYAQLAQDAVDWLAYAQTDVGTRRGTWGYTANDTTSAPEVNGRGLVPMALANAATFGATVPPWTKTEHQFWLTYDRHGSKDNRNGGFGYDGPNDVYVNVPMTAGELIGHLWVGNSATDQVSMSGLGYLYRYWTLNNYDGGGAWNVHLGNSSAMYFTSQLMRGMSLSTFSNWDFNNNVTTGTPRNWLYDYTAGAAGQNQPGLALNLIMRQIANGNWSDTTGNDAATGVPTVALGVLTLDGPNPFGATPVTANAKHTVDGINGWNTTATVNEVVTTTGAVTSVTCSDGTTTFSASGSGSTWTAAITGEGTHNLTCTATGSTASATSAVDVVKIDSIAPEVSGTPSREPGATGWYGNGLTVAWSATDAGSGVATVSDASSVDEGDAQQVYGSATDKAGNTGFGSAGPLQVDTTAPITTFAPLQGSPTNADFAGFEWIATDNLSGVATTSITVDGVVNDYEGAPSGVFGVGGEGTHHVTFTSVDSAGNEEVSRTVTVVVDHSAPVVSANIAPSPRNGWYQATATVTVSCADLDLGDGTPGSGIAACGIAPTATATASYDEGRWTVEVVGADVAGNETRQAYDVLVDQTAPTVVAVADRQANAAGWYDSPVAVNFTCADPSLATGGDGSGVARCTDTAFVGDGTQAIVSGDGEDVAGNVGHSAGLPIKVDDTNPVITWTANGSPFLAPWYSGPVTIAFTCADPDGGSGISVCPQPVTFTGEGRNLSTTVQGADVAGNVAGLTVAGVNIDRSAPEVSAQLSSEAGSNGWHDAATTIHWSCRDTLLADGTPGAGVVSCPADVTVADGANQLFTATVTDAAGNTSAEARTILSQDTVRPTLAGHTTSAPNGAGWYRADVTVAWDADDALSGVDPATRPTPSVISAEGTGLTAAASVQDKAGNLTTATSPAVAIDRTAPATVAALAGDGPGGWFNRLPVEVGLASVDNLSGVTKVAYALDGVPGTITGDAGIVSIAREGRHTLTFSATDAAGNIEPVQTLVVNVDLDAPVISAAISPAPIGAWNTTPVTVTLTCADPDLADHSPGSGISVCSAGGDAVSGNGANGAKTSALPVPTEGRHTVAGVAADVARNVSALSVDANIDARAPRITARTARPAGLTGWFTSPVDVQFDCDELPLADGSPGSGVASCPAAQTVAVDTAAQVVGGTTFDVAGNSSSASTTVKLDATAPVVTFTVNGSTTIAPWYSGPVTVAFTCTDARSGIADCPSPVTLTREASNQSVLGQARDVAGNTTDIDVAGINIDVTGPTAVAGLSSAANAAGWHRSPVTVAWTCIDPNLADDGSGGSGVASCPDPTDLGEGRNQVVTASSVDRAGNAGARSSVTADVDLTPPTITGAATPPGAGGWYRDDVSVAWTVGDALSGVDPATAPLPTVISGEGSALSAAASVADLAGNPASTTVSGIKIDRTAPVTQVTGAPADWTAQGVTLTLGATDALSGVAATRYRLDGGQPVTGTSVAITTDGRHRVELWSVDVAGNIEPSRTLDVLVDASSPHVTYTMTPGLNGNGWANAAVALEFTCVDPGSGLASCTDGAATTTVTAAADGSSAVAKMTVATEGAGQTRTVIARDRTGNTGSATAAFGIDTTAPTVTGAAATPANANGWYRSPVSVGFTCADPAGANGTAGSGLATCADPVTVGEGAARSATGGAVDRAGNGASATVSGLNVDLTAPTLTFQATGTNGTGGWFTGAVTVHASATDALSGIVVAGVPTDVVLGADGAGQQVSGTVLDRAGNQGSGTITGINIDRTAPTVVVNRVVTATAVSVSFVCTDATSGVVACPAAYAVTTSSPARTFTVADGAGNTKSVTVEGINVDATPPTITFTGNAGTYTVAATVAITCTATDAGSGVRSSTCVNVNAPAYTFGVGTEVLTASATDNAGNVATKSTTFTVTVGYESVCQLHLKFIEGSAKFQALKPNQRAGGDAIGNALCQLASILDRANPNARTGLLNAYRTLVSVNVAQGWLTPAQGTTLQTLAGSL